MTIGRIILRVALDGRRVWATFGVDVWPDGIARRSPYARRWHRSTEDLPLWPATGRRLLLGPVHLVILWRASRRTVAARARASADAVDALLGRRPAP